MARGGKRALPRRVRNPFAYGTRSYYEHREKALAARQRAQMLAARRGSRRLGAQTAAAAPWRRRSAVSGAEVPDDLASRGCGLTQARLAPGRASKEGRALSRLHPHRGLAAADQYRPRRHGHSGSLQALTRFPGLARRISGRRAGLLFAFER